MHVHAIDNALVNRVMRADRRAHNHIYKLLEGGLKAFVQRYAPPGEDPADIVQDTMLEVWTSAEKFKGQSSFKSWIYAIAKNKAVDRARKAARRSKHESEPEMTHESDCPSKLLERKQEAAAVCRCVERLKPVQKAVIKHAYFTQLPYSEIAVLESCPLGTVKTRISAAKAALQHSLTQV